MKKVEIEFDTDFDTNTVCPKQIGRVYLGEHVARVVFTPQGKTVMIISKAALDDGSLLLFDEPKGGVYGFGEAP